MERDKKVITRFSNLIYFQNRLDGKVWQSRFNAIVKKGLRDGPGKPKEYGSNPREAGTERIALQ